MGSKRFPKLGGRDSLEKWNRNINTKLSTIPLCAGGLETGALKNPRVEPKPEFKIFMDENRVFDTQLFQYAIMLYYLLDMLRDKLQNFYIRYYPTVLTKILCTAQEIVGACPKDFRLLYVRLLERL